MDMANITLSPAEPRDFEDYYAIRCGKSDMFWMGYEKPPVRDAMERLFMGRLGTSRLEQPGDKRIYMIQADEKNVGFIQFSLGEEGLEFGYSVLDGQRGKGYGSAGMKQAVVLAKEYETCCFAHIRDDNIASITAMTRAGLKPTDDAVMKYFPQSGLVGYRKYIL